MFVFNLFKEPYNPLCERSLLHSCQILHYGKTEESPLNKRDDFLVPDHGKLWRGFYIITSKMMTLVCTFLNEIIRRRTNVFTDIISFFAVYITDEPRRNCTASILIYSLKIYGNEIQAFGCSGSFSDKESLKLSDTLIPLFLIRLLIRGRGCCSPHLQDIPRGLNPDQKASSFLRHGWRALPKLSACHESSYRFRFQSLNTFL